MIENELKYVLTEDLPSGYFDQYCGSPTLIHQGYLPGKARIRSKRATNGMAHYFTYKLAVGETVFEIEKKITFHEFETLWPHTKKRLTKQRYLFMDGVVQWDIDLFYAKDTRYFVMAEAEMPETMREPPRVPDFLQAVLWYAVPRSRTKEFTSSKLSDPRYAKLKSEELRNGSLS